MRISDWSSDVCSSDLIQSLGAKPIFVEDVKGIEGEGSGGYAGEMSDEYKKSQAELVSRHIAKQALVITTALIPGDRQSVVSGQSVFVRLDPCVRRIRKNKQKINAEY